MEIIQQDNNEKQILDSIDKDINDQILEFFQKSIIQERAEQPQTTTQTTTQTQSQQQSLNNTVTASGSSATASSRLMASVNKFLGETYSNAKRLKPGFADCSGFTNKVFKDLGFDLKGATSIYMHRNLTDKVDLENIQPGDLAFLQPTSTRNVCGTVRSPGTSSHVAIVLERQGTKVKVAECTPKGGSHIQWWEVGDPSKKEKGVINYAKGNGGRNMILGFGRLKGVQI